MEIDQDKNQGNPREPSCIRAGDEFMKCDCCGLQMPVNQIKITPIPEQRWQICHWGWDRKPVNDDDAVQACNRNCCPHCVATKGSWPQGPQNINYHVYICGCHTSMHNRQKRESVDQSQYTRTSKRQKLG